MWLWRIQYPRSPHQFYSSVDGYEDGASQLLTCRRASLVIYSSTPGLLWADVWIKLPSNKSLFAWDEEG